MIRIEGKEYSSLKQALADVQDSQIIEIDGCVHEQVVIDKPNITVRGGTIEYDLGAYEILDDGIKRGTFRTYTVFVDADNVTFENVRVINSNGHDEGQAIALMIDGNDFRAVNCLFSSYQDTLFLGPLPESEYEKGGFRGPLENRERVFRRATFEKCLIEGSIDFIFGGGQGYFHDCEIRSLDIQQKINGYVCAPSTPADETYGFIFDHCDFTAEEGMDDTVYLARPWRDYGKCMIVNSHLGKHIRQEGYSDWDKEHARKTCEFKEYNTGIDLRKRVSWLRDVNKEDLKYISSLNKEEKMNDINKKIHDIGIVPVIALENVEDAAPLARALCNGGLPVAEVTYRTAAAHDAMIEMRKACPEMIIGAGTVLTKEQVDSAIDAGAEFIVSPGTNPVTIKYCQEKGIPIFPGTANGADIETAMSFGLKVVKFFPAEPLGGLKMIKALAAPYNTMKFMPTGGVNEGNVNSYLNDPVILACGGTWMIDKKAIAEKNFDRIEELTRDAVNTMLGIKIKHIGINEENGNGLELAKQFARFFGGKVRETSKGWFGSELVEVMNEGKKKGTHGHIAVGVNNVDRAKRYFEAQGYEFDEDSATFDEKGNMKFIYFKDEIGGFAIHLVL
ncbi:MAG: bifunctional 4-hydroxy-2-oxoglutarate aldolase/2-dehydro-3-deoxy-phosphogluconate aldolase [Erysipelotrichaceae bacterium]|nr:bifunctional 4-hydroxy-2-oxoglutarate aldolase/2-dehydro-3-deoxy-phosphogluconate aldolase [Erysipelotrichaceae bacterium]